MNQPTEQTHQKQLIQNDLIEKNNDDSYLSSQLIQQEQEQEQLNEKFQLINLLNSINCSISINQKPTDNKILNNEEHTKNFEKISLSFNHYRLQIQDSYVIGQIKKNLTKLEDLSISIFVEISSQIIDILKLLFKVKQLKRVSLMIETSSSQINDAQWDALAESISELHHISHFKLQINYNKLINKRIIHLFNHFNKLSQLDSLEFQIDQNIFDNQSYLDIGRSLEQLTALNSLKLNFGINKVYINGITTLLKCIEDLKQLRNISLCLSQNSIETQSLKCMMKSLTQISQLQILQLIILDNKLYAEGGYAFKQGFMNMSNLIELSFVIRNTFMSFDGYKQVSEGISCLVKLVKLELVSEDNLGDTNYEILVSKIRTLKQLKYINLRLSHCKSKNINKQIYKAIRLTVLNKN